MTFLDFQVRAWTTGANEMQVLVHSSPVGDLCQPVSVTCDRGRLLTPARVFENALWHSRGSNTHRQIVRLGRQLAKILFPQQVWELFLRSLERVSLAQAGLRLRLCLDDSLVDLPWEFLFRPDVRDEDSLDGFLILDPRISLVRGAPTTSHAVNPSKQKQRMVYAGALWSDGSDWFTLKEEHSQLSQALAPVKPLLTLGAFNEASGDFIERQLKTPAAIFHYSGHTDVADGRGYLAKEIADRPDARHRRADGFGDVNFSYEPLSSRTIASWLRQAGTSLSVFSACNSGRWTFAEPLVKAGLPVVVGTHGVISNIAAIAFCHKLYADLAIGLSLDEAVSAARLHLLETSGNASYEWAAFMVYITSAEAVLFPRPETDRTVRKHQNAARREHQQTLKTHTDRVPESTSTKRFRVALSFPGEHRKYVKSIAKALAKTLTEKTVFYDEFHTAELARPGLDDYLQQIYHSESELLVVCICHDYAKKEWCQLEWRAIRDLIKKRHADDIMLVRLDDVDIAKIPGLFSIDGYVSAADRPASDVASLICERLDLVRTTATLPRNSRKLAHQPTPTR